MEPKILLQSTISDDADYRIYLRKLTMERGFCRFKRKNRKNLLFTKCIMNLKNLRKSWQGIVCLPLKPRRKGEISDSKSAGTGRRKWDSCVIQKKVIVNENIYTTELLKETVEDSYKRLIAPAIEREIRMNLTEKAENGAIHVFGKNLEQLLMQPPIVGKVVLGWDPAFRTGCKLAVVDQTGKGDLDTTVIYPTAPTNRRRSRQ